MKNSIIKIITYTITILCIFLGIEILAIYKNEPSIYPHLNSICNSFLNLFKGKNLKIIFSTLFRILVSVIISYILTLIIGFLYLINDKIFYILNPIITIMRSLPLVIISIFLFILFNSQIAPYIITLFVVLPLSIEGIITGINNLEPVLKDDLKLINTNLIKSMYYVYIPMLKNTLVMIFVQIFGLGFKVMIMGELICYTKNSIGKELSFLKSSFEISDLIAWGILIISIVFIIEIIVKVLNKKVFH